MGWLESYLHNRSYYIYCLRRISIDKAHDHNWWPTRFTSGPLLFNIFINDVTSCFKYSTPYLYVYNLIFMRIILSPYDSHYLQEDLDNVVHWCRVNDMELNFNKCHNSLVHSQLEYCSIVWRAHYYSFFKNGAYAKKNSYSTYNTRLRLVNPYSCMNADSNI